MTPASRTPEGSPNCCPVCGSIVHIEPSQPAGDAPCPVCGHLLWFRTADLAPYGIATRLDAEELRKKITQLLPEFTPTERQIIELRLQGQTNDEITAHLHVVDRKIRRTVERLREMLVNSAS